MARRDRDLQHRQRHHMAGGDVRDRPHIPEQDDDGAEGEQRAERSALRELADIQPTQPSPSLPFEPLKIITQVGAMKPAWQGVLPQHSARRMMTGKRWISTT